MVIESSSGLSVLVTLAAYLLALSLFVQVLQETYKFLSSSKSRTTRKVLQDYLGPLWNRAVAGGGLIDLQVRGPLQFMRLRPKGDILPPEPAVITEALEGSAPPWIQQVVSQLRFEAGFQKQKNGETDRSYWSPAWSRLIDDLAAADKGSPGYRTAQELTEFLATFGFFPSKAVSDGAVPAIYDRDERPTAGQLLEGVRQRFLPSVVKAEKGYPQLEKNFDYAYRRRNLRQTFLLGMAAAFAFNLPFDALYQAARQVTPSEAAAIAAQAAALHDQLAQRTDRSATEAEPATPETDADSEAPSTASDDSDEDRLAQAVEDLSSALEILPVGDDREDPVDYLINGKDIKAYLDAGPVAVARFVFGCLLTAMLISLGAPFWNDITGLLVHLQKSRSAESTGGAK